MNTDTRSRILLAAKDEFLAVGLGAASIASICRRAQIANGTFYLHFRSNDEVCQELIAIAASELADRLRVANSIALDARSKDKIDVAIIFAFAEEREDLFKLMWDEKTANSMAHATFVSVMKGQRTEAIRLGQENGDFRPDLDPSLAAIADIAVTTELVQHWLSDRSAHDKNHVIEQLIALRARMFFP